MDDARPHDVAIAAHDRVRPSVFDSFIREQRRVNAPKCDPCPASAHRAADLVPAPGVPGVDTDPDDTDETPGGRFPAPEA
ncbi:MAG TPA: hypothetical protein VHH91_09970 [Vicinamibacterales bacterium]|nr:hypothetical protein [Vicinamibacterales bacterium]